MSDIFACGIDLGTANTRLAYQKDGKPVILDSENGNWSFSSIVCFKSDKEIIVGDAAKYNTSMGLGTTVYDIKRLIGKKIDDPVVQEDKSHYPFVIDEDYNKNVIIKIDSDDITTKFTPEKITSLLLKKMIKQAESSNQLKKDQTKYAVIAVPACFTDSQRKATLEAGKLAGFNVLRLINEPTAAAIAYAYENLKDEDKKGITKNILVCDFGAGSFDVSVIKIEDNEITVLASGGDDHLGGEDITNRLVNYFLKLKEEQGIDISNDKKSLMRLRRACEEVKIRLSSSSEAYLDCEILEDNGVDFTITQSTFTVINRDIFDKTIRIVKEVLFKSSISIETIDDILLVGGSSRIPEIRRLIRSEFTGVRICEDINPEEAVVRGCSILAYDLCRKLISKPSTLNGPDKPSPTINDPDPCPGNPIPILMKKKIPSYNFIIKDILTHNISTLVADEKGDERVFVLIYKNRRIPYQNRITFTTAEDNETEIDFNYSECDSYDVDEFKRNEVKITKKIRPMRRGEIILQQGIKVDENGIITMTVEEEKC